MSVTFARKMAQFICNLSVLGPVILSALDNPDMTTIAVILIISIAFNGVGMSGYLVHYYSSCVIAEYCHFTTISFAGKLL